MPGMVEGGKMGAISGFKRVSCVTNVCLSVGVVGTGYCGLVYNRFCKAFSV